MSDTTHVAEVAVPGQSQVTVRLSHGEIELGQEYDHEHHAIYVQPDNVLRLVRAMLVMVGLEDAYLYTQRPGGLCNDLDWPEGPFSRREVAMMNARPDIDWQAVNADADAAGLSDEREDFDEAEGVTGSDADPVAKPKDSTAAERSRRYRQNKKRDAKRDAGRDASRVTSLVTEEPRLIAAE